MPKKTEEQKQERLNFERAVRLTIHLIDFLIEKQAPLDVLGCSQREKDVLQMKWKYGLTIEQIAANLSLSKERARQIHDSVITKIYVRLPGLLDEYPEKKHLHLENEKLKRQIAELQAKLDSLTPENQQRLRENDVANKKIADIDLSTRTLNRLSSAGIKTVRDLLQHNTVSLFAIKGFTPRTMMEIEAFLLENFLALKEG